MNWKDKNVLITGVSGFVGSYLAKRLLEKEANVFGLIRSRSDGKLAQNLTNQRISNNIHLIEGDLTDITSLASCLDKSEPDYIFHLAAQSFVPKSFQNPMETQQINCLGTSNLLDVMRIKDHDSKIIFAGSSEEYGLVISSEEQYDRAKKEYGTIFPEPENIFPEPENIPELPIKETNPLRPMSPYAVSKVYGDYLMRNYYHTYGLKTVVSRAFNHEGAGRSLMFVTSVITNQIMKLKLGETDKITIGNINAFRDWSHVLDIINGYLLLAEKGDAGEVYNQGSMRTNSVLTYILLGLEEAGWNIDRIRTVEGEKTVDNPTELDKSKIFGMKFEKTKIDNMLLREEIEYTIEDREIIVQTNKGDIEIEFDPARFRPAEVPILLANTEKIQKIGAKNEYRLNDIIKDQLNYFLNKDNRT
ncbi:MAG: GDP-mannose 4,6-dehydratase [Methanobacteriaceae archaeon]